MMSQIKNMIGPEEMLDAYSVSATWDGGPWEIFSLPADHPAARPLGIRAARFSTA